MTKDDSLRIRSELVQEIVQEIADSKNKDPSELEYPLQAYINVDALQQLVSHESSTWTLTFELPEQRIVVTSDSETTVEAITKTHPKNRPSKTDAEILGHCPQCGAVFERNRDSGNRNGYVLLGKGAELSLIRCEGCTTELPVPEATHSSQSP